MLASVIAGDSSSMISPYRPPATTNIRGYWGHDWGHQADQPMTTAREIKGFKPLFWFNV
jgi:hypothetical protein